MCSIQPLYACAMALRLNVAAKALGNIQEKREVCCNTEDQKTVLKVGRDLQTAMNFPPHMMALWEA